METYKCCNGMCKFEWVGKSGLPCQKCGSLYYEWVSFKEWKCNEESGKWVRVKEKIS
jgi:hypothetical protein